jgi:DNA-binding transcriptional ArsR family regulator
MRCRPTVARQHLSKLRFAGLLEGQRQGQRVVYRSRGGHVRALLTDALQADHHVSGGPVYD